ncbi:hypothetical protein AGDE_13468 [Angomonas deanei]|uniref:Uncharacterized protein n=1 Tax=Angomonas deanei TaxID=59799 RepID=A0A7G2CKH4_9TRYP|nr:hypothetical protein AGDE_13468 [Angomonas deanei]CAD2219909.1 hypothetical protein, conserved [Angomonas deanei]|eukprot:EPY22321.1 hypothetical protein AGDE_13468 [Angomonas deanei]
MQPSAAPYPQTMADAMLSLVEEQYKKLLYVHACSLVTIAETMAQEWQTMYQPAPRRPVASPRTPVAPLCAKEDSTASPRGQSTMGKLRSLFQPIKFMDEEKDNDVCSIHPERMKQAIWREDWEMDLESAHRRQLLQNYSGPSAMSLLFSLYVTQERDDAQRRKRGELPQGEVNSSMLVELYFNHKIRHHQRAVESILFDFTYLILVGIPAMRMLETHSRRLICMTRDLFIREQIELFVTTSPKYTKTARRAHRKELMLAPFRVAKWGWGDKPLPDTTKAIINNMGVDFKEKPSELPRAPTSPSTSSPRNVVFSVIEVGPAPSAAVAPTSSEEVSRPKGFLSRPLLERRGTPLSIQHSFVSGDSIHSSEVNIPKKNDTVHSHIKSHIKHLRSKSKSSTTSETTSVVRENSSGDYGRNLSVTEESRDFSRASAGSPLSLSKETTVVVESVPVAVKEEDAVVAIPQEKEAEAETPEVPEVVAPITEEVATAAVPAAVAAPEAAATLKGVKGRNKRERLHINGYYGRPPTQGTNLYKEMVREPSVSMLVHKKKTDEEPPATEPMLKPGRARRLSERSATSSRSTSRSMSNSNPTLPGRRRSSSSSTSGVLPPIPRIYRKYDTELDPHKDTYMSYSRVVKKGDGVNPPTLRARERMIPAKVQPVKGYVPPEPKSPKVEDIVGLDELVGNAKFDK